MCKIPYDESHHRLIQELNEADTFNSITIQPFIAICLYLKCDVIKIELVHFHTNIFYSLFYKPLGILNWAIDSRSSLTHMLYRNV